MEILVPVHAKLAAHTTRHVVVRYGLVPTAREPILNRQCGHLQPLATPHRCTKAPTGNHGRYTWPTSVTQKGVFPQLLLTHTKGFSLLTPQRSHPNTFRMDFP